MDSIHSAAMDSQRIAHKLGALWMANEVYGWAAKHIGVLTTEQLKELLDIIHKEPA